MPSSVFDKIDLSKGFDERLPIVPQVYEVLRRLILSLHLEPGMIVPKSEFAKRFAVSPMPIREALRRLEEEGLVVIKPQSGTYVAPIDIQSAWEAQFLRIALEVEIVRKVAETIDAQGVRTLQSILVHQTLEFETENKEGFVEDDAAFHRSMYEIADVNGLWRKVRVMRAHIDRLRMLHLPEPGKMESILGDHHAILDAVSAQDPSRAETAMRGHLSGTLVEIESFRNKYPQYF